MKGCISSIEMFIRHDLWFLHLGFVLFGSIVDAKLLVLI